MNEDRARKRKEQGPENLAMMRRVTLARAEKSKGAMRGKLIKARWHEPFMLNLIRAACHVHKRLPWQSGPDPFT